MTKRIHDRTFNTTLPVDPLRTTIDDVISNLRSSLSVQTTKSALGSTTVIDKYINQSTFDGLL